MFYVSADHMYFSSHSLIDLVDEFSKEGGGQIFIDEIHKYENWSRELKQIYDTHHDVKVVFTGSSVLDIYKGQADLSRRAPIFMMQGMSFREYLMLFHQIEVPVYTLRIFLSIGRHFQSYTLFHCFETISSAATILFQTKVILS